MEKLYEKTKNTDTEIGIIETLWWNDIVLMLPNFVGDYPIAWWDKTDKEGIDSYWNNLSPFTELLTENKKNKILQINYPQDGNFIFVFKKIISYLKKNNLVDKKITVYWQSMWWKVALYLTYFLLKHWYNIEKIILNSSVLDKETVSLPVWLPSSILAKLFPILRKIPSKKLIWIMSAAKDDSALEINPEELTKIVDNLKAYKVKYKQLKSRLDFIKKQFNQKVANIIRENKTKILVIRSIPSVENSNDDWMVKHNFVDKLQDMFPDQVKCVDVSSWHCQVPEKNRLYAKALADLLDNN